MEDRRLSSWLTYINTPAYYSWRGNAFEIVCLNHINQIKTVLGISGIESMQYSWRSRSSTPGAQIDLMIDRKDGVVNICEMKYTTSEFDISASYMQNLNNKIRCLAEETGSRKAFHLTLICANGLKPNSYADMAQQIIAADQLFI